MNVTIRGFVDTNAQQWVEVDHNGKSALLAYRKFAYDRSSIWSQLADKDVVIIAKAAKASVIQQVEDVDAFTEKLIFARPGWCQGQFANASGKVFAPPGAAKGAVAFTPQPSKCSKRGTHSGWKSQIGRKLVGHPIPSFLVMTCFAAPLLELVGRTDNFGFELTGQGGKGKSTTQRLMASVIGPAMEKDRGYITTFDMTRAALEKSMQWHSDMSFLIDEGNLLPGSGSGGGAKGMMRDFCFQMSSGTTKGRHDNPQQNGYRFIYVTSANEPFTSLLGETHRDVAGAATDRLMSITVPEGDAGVFGPLPTGYENYRQFTLALESAMTEQYGTAMPKFMRKLVRQRHHDEGKLKEEIRDRIEAFKQEVGVNENNGSDVRVAEAFGLVYAAGCLAQTFAVIPGEIDCLGAAVECYTNFRRTVPVRRSLPERLSDIASRPQTLTIDEANLPTLSDRQMEDAGAFIRVVKGKKLLLMMPAFGRMMFPDWNAIKNTSDFAELNKADKGRRGRGYHCRIRSNSETDWFYCFVLPDPVATPKKRTKQGRKRPDTAI